MKKLLTILLSVFMIATSFTMNVFASDEPDYFCITNISEDPSIVTWSERGSNIQGKDLKLKYKIDGQTVWQDLEIIQNDDPSASYKQEISFSLPAGGSAYFKGNEIFINENSKYYVNCDKDFKVSGDITTLISENGNVLDISDKSYVFYQMFNGAEYLVSAKDLKLPSTTLSKYCYNYLFEDCTKLEEAPTLPATRMVESCYAYMFKGCSKLETAPVLPAMELANNCYESMFEDCSSLKIAPALPATELFSDCYNCMFCGCSELEIAPSLPATELAYGCYNWMFGICSSLKTAPILPATELAGGCCTGMFDSCENLERIVFFGTALNDTYTSGWVNGVKDVGTFITPTFTVDNATYGSSFIPKDTGHKWLLTAPVNVKVNATEGYKVLYSAPKTDGTAEENEKANAQHTVVGIPDGIGNVNYVFGSNETAYIIPQSGFKINSVKVDSIQKDPVEGVYSFTPRDGCLVEIDLTDLRKVDKPQGDTTVFKYTGSELTYSIASSDKYTIFGNKKTEVGSYDVIVSLNEGYYWSDKTIDDLKFSFVIFPKDPTISGKITTNVVNTNTEVKDAGLKTITEDEAKTIVNTDPNLSNLKQAINNGKNIIIYTEVENPSDESKTAFTSRNIDESNAVILDINLYGEIKGEANSKKKITDTNGYKTTVSITLTPQQAQKINIANNKNYFILRQHAGQIEKIPATLTIDADGNYVFTFETDKFSAYAIYSENKPAPKPKYVVPNTGVK